MQFERGKDIKRTLKIGKEGLLKRYGIEITRGTGNIPEIFTKKEGNKILIDIETTSGGWGWEIDLEKMRKAFAVVVIYGEYFNIAKCRVKGFYINNAMYPIERLEEVKDQLLKAAKEFYGGSIPSP